MKYLIIAVLSCAMFSNVSYSAENTCQIIVRFENYAAQSHQNEDLTWHGLDVDFAKALLDEAGCEYRFVSIPWGRSLKMLENGEVDLMLSVSKTAQRMRFAYFIGPQKQENIVFAMNAERSYSINTVSSLFELDAPIAIQRGAYYGSTFEKRFIEEQDTDERFIYVPDNQLKLDLLRHGRISGFLEEKYNIVYQVQNNPDFMKVTISPFVINSEPVYFAFSKTSVSKLQIKKFEKAFLNIKKSGKLAVILKKYNLE
ncbi:MULTISPECIES: transporter substrate-binding domain-containing protein [Pseudoalteromonas]|nr:transporter substrate-binding domain-containing protein [Pseudoalteromonas porphyrae]